MDADMLQTRIERTHAFARLFELFISFFCRVWWEIIACDIILLIPPHRPHLALYKPSFILSLVDATPIPGTNRVAVRLQAVGHGRHVNDTEVAVGVVDRETDVRARRVPVAAVPRRRQQEPIARVC